MSSLTSSAPSLIRSEGNEDSTPRKRVRLTEPSASKSWELDCSFLYDLELLDHPTFNSAELERFYVHNEAPFPYIDPLVGGMRPYVEFDVEELVEREDKCPRTSYPFPITIRIETSTTPTVTSGEPYADDVPLWPLEVDMVPPMWPCYLSTNSPTFHIAQTGPDDALAEGLQGLSLLGTGNTCDNDMLALRNEALVLDPLRNIVPGSTGVAIDSLDLDWPFPDMYPHYSCQLPPPPKDGEGGHSDKTLSQRLFGL